MDKFLITATQTELQDVLPSGTWITNMSLTFDFVLHCHQMLFVIPSSLTCATDWSTSLGMIRKKPFRTNVRFSSVAQSCPTLCDPMNCSTPGLPVHYQFPESSQTHVPWVIDAIQPSHPLSSPSPPALNLSQHQGLFKWVSSSYQVAKVLEFQLQHQSFQWTPRTDLP